MSDIVKILLVAFFSSSLFAQEIDRNLTSLDSMVAIVNEGIVLNSQLNSQIQIVTERAKDGFTVPSEEIVKEQILEQLILEEIQLQRADGIGIRVSDQMLNGAISLIAEQNNTTFERLPDQLKRDGIDYGDFRDLRKQLILDQLRDIDVIGRINASDRELNQCLGCENNIINESQYNLSHILISVPEAATADGFDNSRNEAMKFMISLNLELVSVRWRLHILIVRQG